MAIIPVGAYLILSPGAGSLSLERDQVETATARQAQFQDYLPIRAEVAPSKIVLLGAVTGGQVERVEAADGEEVVAGQVLARLTNPQLRLDVGAREADVRSRLGETTGQQLNLQNSRVGRDREIAEAEFHLVQAHRALAARQQLASSGFVSDAFLKPYREEADYYQSRVAALKSARQRADLIADGQAAAIRDTATQLSRNLREVQASLDTLVVRAPMSGRLTNFQLQTGQSLKAGDPVGQIDSEGDYKLVADVDEFFLGRVTLGLPALADANGVSYELKVSRVLPQVTRGRFHVEMTFPRSAPAGLRRGQSLSGRITLGDPSSAIVLANGAWLDGGGGSSLFILRRGGRTAERRSVVVGRRNPEQVEIVKGVAPGEQAIVSSYAGWEKFKTLILK